MQAHRPFLGSVPDLSSIDLGREVIIAPHGASRRQVRDDIATALSTGSMTSAQDSKTRGSSGWVATNSFGRIGHLGSGDILRRGVRVRLGAAAAPGMGIFRSPSTAPPHTSPLPQRTKAHWPFHGFAIIRDQHVRAEDPADLPQGEDLRTPQPLFTQLFTDIGRSESYIGGTGDAVLRQSHTGLRRTNV